MGVASYVAQTVASGAATAAQWLLNAAMDANPIMLVVLAVVALVAVFYYLYNSNETVRNAINWLFDGLKALGGYIMGGLMAAWNGLLTILKPITDALGKLWSAISNKGAQNSTSVFSQLSGVLHSLWTIISSVANLLISSIYSDMEYAFTYLNSCCKYFNWCIVCRI